MNKKIISIDHIFFEGNARNYEVIDRNLEVPCPKYFISYNNGKPFISDEVPKQFRPPMVRHELYEFEKLNPEDDKSCLTALIQEIIAVPNPILNKYLKFRKEVFRELVDFHKKHKTPQINKINKSLDYLNSLIL